MPGTTTRPAITRLALERSLHRLLQRYTIHELLHVLVETCYRQAGIEEDSRHKGLSYYTSNWREVARHLTTVEAACTTLELKL